jgi:hypothetical protein
MCGLEIRNVARFKFFLNVAAENVTGGNEP